MQLEDGAGLRAGTAGIVRIIFTQGYKKLDLSAATRTVTIVSKLNGGADLAGTTVTKVSLDGVETAGASGAVDVAFTAGNLSAAGVITMEATFGGTPTPLPNPNERVIRVPVRAAHSDAP